MKKIFARACRQNLPVTQAKAGSLARKTGTMAAAGRRKFSIEAEIAVQPLGWETVLCGLRIVLKGGGDF